MKIIDVEPNSLAWLQARVGVLTASEFDNLVTPKFEPRKGQMVQTYLNRKIAETWQGYPLPNTTTLDMEAGHIWETEILPWYEFEFDEQIQRVGFITTDDGRIGCSPDGLLGNDSGVELKAPLAHNHVGYLRLGEPPPEYLAQIHGCMLVTGRPTWKFISYRRGFPPIVKVVERDEKIQAVLKETLYHFVEVLDYELARLTEMNGGKRPEKPKTLLTPETEDDGYGIIP